VQLNVISGDRLDVLLSCHRNIVPVRFEVERVRFPALTFAAPKSRLEVVGILAHSQLEIELTDVSAVTLS
jgi:hypothetical protein